MFIPDPDPIHKITIVPRGMAMGVTSFLPSDDRHSYTLGKLESMLSMLIGGRAAEKLMMDTLSTGAGNDLEKATTLARKMVCEWGMSTALGPVTHSDSSDTIFLGRDINRMRDYSEDTARTIDSEVKRLVEEAYSRAMEILEANRDIVESIADRLLEKETISGAEIRELIEELRPDGRGVPSIPSLDPVEDEPVDGAIDGEERND